MFLQDLVVIVLILTEQQDRRRNKNWKYLWGEGDWHGLDVASSSVPPETKKPVRVFLKKRRI